MNMRNNHAIAAAITFGAIAMVAAWADVNLAADKKSGGSRFGDILGGTLSFHLTLGRGDDTAVIQHVGGIGGSAQFLGSVDGGASMDVNQ